VAGLTGDGSAAGQRGYSKILLIFCPRVSAVNGLTI
jgi:hypothetical protein